IKAGIPVAEKAILELRQKDRWRWAEFIEVYFYALPSQEVSEPMLLEMIAYAEALKGQPGRSRMERLGEFGPKAKAAVPLLEWIRDHNTDAATVAGAAKALKRIKGN